MKSPDPVILASPQIRVLTGSQRMELIQDGKVVRSYAVSTSKFGEGFCEGSFQTPTGLFRICEKIGEGEPQGMCFRSRIPTGVVHAQGGEEDLILTRILWLEGLQKSNANTKERFIYIHGTNQEDRIGTRASHGCVRMKGPDLVELFDFVNVGTPVWIL